MQKIVLPLAGYVFICSVLTAQGFTASRSDLSGLANRHISTADGLPSNVISGIAKDDRGFIWISTNQGFCKWDGFSATVFQHNASDTHSLPADNISRNAFIWDPFRKQLIIGHQQGVSLFDPLSCQFINPEMDASYKNNIYGPVNNLFVDNEGLLWVGTANGFYCMDQHNRVSGRYTFRENLPRGVFLDHRNINEVHDICQDNNHENILWVATLGGLLKFNKTTTQMEWFYYSDPLYLRELNQFNMVIPLDNEVLCLGTWNFDLVLFDTKKGKFSKRIGQNANGKFKTKEGLVPYQQAPGGKVWVSSLEGLGILDTESGEINYLASLKSPNGLRVSFELFLMDNDNLWLGSENGVYLIESETKPVCNFIFKPLDENHWYLTRALLELPQQKQIVIGYGRGEGLHIFDRNSFTFHSLDLPNKSILENTISGFLKIDQEQLLFLSRNHIYRYDLIDYQIELLDISQGLLPTLNDLKMDPLGNIWLATNNAGLQQFNLDKMEVKEVLNESDMLGSGLELPNFSELFIDNYSRIWFRRKGGSYGFYKADIKALRYFGGTDEFIDITCFGSNQGDTLWVAAAERGIGFMDTKIPEKGVQFVYPLDSLPAKYISDIVMDHKNRLWCLTDKGLLRLSLKENDISLFDENYGVITRDSWSGKNNLLPGKLLLLEDGSITIGYRHGLGFFHPDSLMVSFSVPKPYLTSFKINDQEIEFESKNKFVFSHNHNDLAFTYSAHDLYQKGISIQHKLVGSDKQWKNAIPGQSSYYPNLAPGRYTLEIRAVSTSGHGHNELISLPIKIRLPWWETPWAYALFIFIIILTTVLVYRFRMKRQIANRENQRLRELDELKTKLYANITHEFRTPITVIMGMAADLAGGSQKLDHASLKRKVETIQRNSTNLLQLVNQMLDLAKMESGKMIYQPVRNNIIPWLQYIVESHQSLAESKDLQLTFYAETTELEMDYDPDQLSKVMTNLLTNAIKFTPSKGKIIVHVKYIMDNNLLCIKVKDSGIGIPENELQRIFDRFYQVESSSRIHSAGTGIGLSLTREIVEMIGGSITVSSKTSEGSEFEVHLPVTTKAIKDIQGQYHFDKSQLLGLAPNTLDEETNEEIENDKEKAFILIAEDNPDVAGYIRDTIRNQYKVKWAPDGEKALQLAFDLIPDLVITDVMMPGKDGFEVCNTLKQDIRTDHIPVIMLTARVTDTDRISGYEKGADAFLTKPFNKKELLVRLEQLLRLRKQLQAKYGKLEVRAGSGKPASPEEQFILRTSQIVENNLEKSMFNASDLANEVHL
ncbi:MAG: ATP-binding protein [Bacteroidales bacterium]